MKHSILAGTVLGMLSVAAASAQVRPGGVVTQNDLSQLGLLYNQYLLDEPAPANLDELKANIKKDAPNIYKLIDGGSIELLFHKKLSGNIVVAYQKQAEKGIHLAVFGDRAVKKLTPEELKEALKKTE